jgi:hypothetical protein
MRGLRVIVPVDLNEQIRQVQETPALVLRGNFNWVAVGLVAAQQSTLAEVT